MEKELKKFLEDELITHEEIIKTQTDILAKVLRHEKHIDSHTSHLKEMCVAMHEMNKTLENFNSLEGLAGNIETIAKFGKLLRLSMVWIAGLVGAIALIWASFRDGFFGK
ncbi:unnamed protein product [marine sediment metagenome]|uniref:Uncharacterized protein n=1 Tax=marine sediment metagenome TaxID=412755 RepID=X0RNE1_9ZZZZ